MESLWLKRLTAFSLERLCGLRPHHCGSFTHTPAPSLCPVDVCSPRHPVRALPFLPQPWRAPASRLCSYLSPLCLERFYVDIQMPLSLRHIFLYQPNVSCFLALFLIHFSPSLCYNLTYYTYYLYILVIH